MFGDQHLESLGGAQVSMRLQRRFLEKAGHTVTVVAPRMHGPRAAAARVGCRLPRPAVDPDHVRPRVRAHVAGRRTDRFLDAAMKDRPPVDVVHVQADFWGAFIGHRFAARHRLPVVHTMHNRVDVGIEATAPLPGLVLRVLDAWQRRALGGFAEQAQRGRDGWSYLRRLRGAIGCRHRAVVALRAPARRARRRPGARCCRAST